MAAPANERRNEAAHALLAKHFPSKQSTVPPAKTTSRTATVSTNPKKTAQMRQVELMKMRHHAQPADPKDKGSAVPISERLHLKVRVEGINPSERIIWFRKTIGAGRAIDLLAKNFGLSTSSPLHLIKLGPTDTESARLVTDQPLETQVDDGSQVILSR